MGILAWLTGRPKEQSEFCSVKFAELWQPFVQSFVDFGFTGRCEAPPPLPQQASELPTVVPAAERLVAIGDLHGDFKKAKEAFRLAGLTDGQDNWVGGKTVCVQVGDILDRGDHELKILYFLERLQHEAQQAGGRLYVLNGNHETMNVGGTYRYATPGSSIDMARWHLWQNMGTAMQTKCGCMAEFEALRTAVAGAVGLPGPAASQSLRTAALQPGGPVTQRFFAQHPIVLQVGSTVFVHGGVLPAHVDYGLERINSETQQWMLGRSGASPPSFLKGSSAIVWARDYSSEDEERCDCGKLQEVLRSIPGAKRMVVGHTIQDQGINSACNDQVVRIDVGMSKGCGGSEVEVLEILKDQQVRRIQEDKAPVEVGRQPPQDGVKAAADKASRWLHDLMRWRGLVAAAGSETTAPQPAASR